MGPTKLVSTDEYLSKDIRNLIFRYGLRVTNFLNCANYKNVNSFDFKSIKDSKTHMIISLKLYFWTLDIFRNYVPSISKSIIYIQQKYINIYFLKPKTSVYMFRFFVELCGYFSSLAHFILLPLLSVSS